MREEPRGQEELRSSSKASGETGTDCMFRLGSESRTLLSFTTAVTSPSPHQYKEPFVLPFWELLCCFMHH